MSGCIPFNRPAKPTGLNNIGTQSIELVDSNRLEWCTDSKDDLRRIMIQVWYPTQDEEGEIEQKAERRAARAAGRTAPATS